MDIFAFINRNTLFFQNEICLDNFIIGDFTIERMGAQEQEELRQQVTRTRIKYNFCKKAIKAKNSEAGARMKEFGCHHHHHHQSTAAQESIAGAVMQVMAEDFKREKED